MVKTKSSSPAFWLWLPRENIKKFLEIKQQIKLNTKSFTIAKQFSLKSFQVSSGKADKVAKNALCVIISLYPQPTFRPISTHSHPF